MLYQVDDALVHAVSGIELSRYKPNSGSFFPKPVNKSLIASRGADIVMQSSESNATVQFHWVSKTASRWIKP
jgi:hypothetical protein